MVKLVDGYEKQMNMIHYQLGYIRTIKNPNLTKMTEGDGRNDKLFTYILKLQSQGMAKNDIKETISIINNYILKSLLNKMN